MYLHRVFELYTQNAPPNRSQTASNISQEILNKTVRCGVEMLNGETKLLKLQFKSIKYL